VTVFNYVVNSDVHKNLALMTAIIFNKRHHVSFLLTLTYCGRQCKLPLLAKKGTDSLLLLFCSSSVYSLIYEMSNNAACVRKTACMQRPDTIDVIRSKCLVTLYTSLHLRL